jgi:hypothetical protein
MEDKSKKGSHEVKKKLALYKFSTLILGLLISGGILNPQGPILKPFSYTLSKAHKLGHFQKCD